MIVAGQLEYLLGQVSKIRILRFLIRTGQELSGREIAAAVGLSHVEAHTALKELNQHNVVEMRRAGNSILYRLNLKSVLVKKTLIPLFESEARLEHSVAEILSRHLKNSAPKSVILFGSFASGRARPDSDIDVMIVVSKKNDIPAIEDNLRKAEISLTIGFGNHLAPITMDESEFKKRFKNGDKLVRNVVREGKVLFGDSMNDLIKSDD